MKYLLLKHYKGAFADRLKETGEYVSEQALSPEGAFVRSDGQAGRR